MAAPIRNTGPTQSFTASGAITAGAAVKLSSAMTVAVTSAITDNIIGFATETVASGEQVTVQVADGTMAIATAGGTISAGAELMPKASGSGSVDTAAGATAKSCAVAMEGAASGERFTVMIAKTLKSPANS